MILIAKILGIFCIVFIGFGANKAGWLPAESSRYLARIVINIAAPCVVIKSMTEQNMSGDDMHTMLMLILAGVIQVAAVVCLSFPIVRMFRAPKKDRGVYRNLLNFSNNGFMGFPVALAIFGHLGMFYMVILNSIMMVVIFTLGLWNVKKDVEAAGAKTMTTKGSGEETAGAEVAGARVMPVKTPLTERMKVVLKDVFNPAIIALLVGFVLLIFNIKLPEAITGVLTSLGAMMTPLSMMVIGIQLTESSLKEVLSNRRLIAMSLIRLVGLGAVCFLALMPFYLNGMMSGTFVGVLVLNLALPCATVPVMLAEEYGSNVKLAAEGAFLATLFSMISIPIVSVLLGML